MRSLRAWIYIALIGLGASCAPRPKLVYVDLSKAATDSKVVTDAVVPTPEPPLRTPAKTVEAPGMPKRVVSFPVGGDQLEKAREVVAQSERSAVREIAQRLSKTYLGEIDSLFEQRKRNLEPLQREQLDKLFEEIRRRFAVYARQRGPLLVGLAARVGWPDPDPESLLEPDGSNPRRLAVFRAAKSLRERINELDSRYDKQIAGLFAQYQEANDLAMAELRLQIEEMRAQKLQQAEEEARRQVETVRDQIRSLVVGDPSVDLEAVPFKQVAFPSALLKPFAWPRRADPDTSVQEAKTDLAIWLAQNRCVLAPRGEARDATMEFIEWRKKRKNGR